MTSKAPTTGAAAAQLDPDSVAEYREAFDMFDKDGDGALTHLELRTVLESMGLVMTDAELQELALAMDADNSGKIEFSEFLEMMATKQREAENMTFESELREAFQEVDRNGDGFISAFELQQIMNLLGEPLKDDEVREMIAVADSQGLGKVSFEDFQRIVASLGVH